MCTITQTMSPQVLSYLLLFSSVWCQDSILDNLRINPHTVSVSGMSSGACFATQFHTAFSASVST